ncbi:DUF6036 family nucleotidyltransferase [Pseudarthrobacter sp. PS3-L1]|uniref:DUF6036 family nucleotidyltransferase n=1 Tax=Pseudarthrobacter sp. PS3-L1 TaxID=3046207 RepID=UPI0024B9808C|nr:DUF6036 family nucleotidyltransferase [Pseudarthrobacter sp. PS3-L1]MDJ0318981.1 DUF6036 family nucleotidyltransferase [Pseudarthrobacter sp. PS3-L1]
MTAGRDFRCEDVVQLLREVEARRTTRGVALDIQIVGGAALLLHGVLDRATGDIDAQYASSDIVEEVAAGMAAEYGLPPNWLNRNAAAFLPDEAQWIAGPAGTSSGVRLADLPTLAAMKMAAERAKDIEDLGHIVLALRIERAEDLVRLAFDKYGENSIALSAPADNYEIVAEEAMAAADAILLRRRNHESASQVRDHPPHA